MSAILERIVATKWEEVQSARAAVPERELRARLADAPPARDFIQALSSGTRIRLIAEIKKASPSRGLLRPDFHPLEIARACQQNGASCLSVLTDERYFRGSLGQLTAVRQGVAIPVLRKDFIIDQYQLLQARAAGADAVLLIAECLADDRLPALHDRALELGLAPLVEFHLPENCQRVLDTGAMLVGINNRDLRSFHTRLAHTLTLRPQIPPDRLLVSESGIQSHEDLVLLEQAGVNAVLVGEHLMRQPDVGVAVRQLLGSDELM
jgi:indole-3-glycerol phosphate synthase